MSLMEAYVFHEQPRSLHASCMGRAVAGLLKEQYPQHTAKCVASDLRCDVRTAENLLRGHLSAKSITRIIKTYGLGFLIDAGAEVAGTSLQDHLETQFIKARDERITWEARERQLAALRTAVRGGRPAHSGVDGASA